jgi:hypothetical protein
MLVLALLSPVLVLGFLLVMQRFERWMFDTRTDAERQQLRS